MEKIIHTSSHTCLNKNPYFLNVCKCYFHAWPYTFYHTIIKILIIKKIILLKKIYDVFFLNQNFDFSLKLHKSATGKTIKNYNNTCKLLFFNSCKTNKEKFKFLCKKKSIMSLSLFSSNIFVLWTFRFLDRLINPK